MPSNLEREFSAAVGRAVTRMHTELRYKPTRFMRMLAAHGAHEAARRLLMRSDASDGFTRLWEAGRLELNVEAVVLVPRYAELFDDDLLTVARWRLQEHGFDVDAFISGQAP